MLDDDRSARMTNRVRRLGKRGGWAVTMLCVILGAGAIGAWPAASSGAASETAPDARPTLPLTVDAPGKGLLSLGVYDASGTLVRTLAFAKPVEPGAQHFTWDATTDLGLPVKPGTYHAKGIWFPQGPKIHYIMKVGQSGDPPYRTPAGLSQWGGNLGAPTAVCSNDKYVLAVFSCVESSTLSGLQLMTPDGNIVQRFNILFPWDTHWAAVMDDKRMFLAAAVTRDEKLRIYHYDIGTPKGKVLAVIPTGDHRQAAGRWKGRWHVDVRGLALLNDRLYVPVLLDDKLWILDASSGKILSSVSVDSPRGIAAHDGKLYMLSGDKLVSINAAGHIARTIISDGLDDPSGLAIARNGDFYISDRGDAQQVKVYTPGGKLLRTIGVKGGRPSNGFYNPKGMLEPAGICIGPKGNLWVAEYEEHFQRVSVWNAHSGALEQEYFNTRWSSGRGRMSPDRTLMYFANGRFADHPGIDAYHVDFEKGTWYPAWSLDMPYSIMQQEDVVVGYDHRNNLHDHTYPYLSFAGAMIRGDNGKLYMFDASEGSLWLFDRKTLKMKLAALISPHRAHRLKDGRYQMYYDKGANRWLTWSDLNGDGKLEKNEVTLADGGKAMEATRRIKGLQLQPDLSVLVLLDNYHGHNKKPTVGRLVPRRILGDGVPVYNWEDLETTPLDFNHKTAMAGGGSKSNPAVPVRASSLSRFRVIGDSIYVTARTRPAGKRPMLPGKDGEGWWASRNWRMTPMRFDLKTGHSAWLKLGRRAPAQAKPGQMYYPGWTVAGQAGGCLFVPDTLDQVWVWTTDGLYLGGLYDDPPGLNANSLHAEQIGAWIYTIDGKVYACAGDHGVYVHQVELPERTAVDGGDLVVTPVMAEAAQPWNPDGPIPNGKPVYTAYSVYNWKTRKHVYKIDVDGRITPEEWANFPAAPIVYNGKQVATVRAAFDRWKLYLAYHVKTPNGFKNAGTELPYAPFVSGAYVDFDIARDWADPQRSINKPGDVRVIMADITGQTKPYQMAFWPIREAVTGSRRHPHHSNPQTISSPAAHRHFDDISPIDDLKFVSQKTAGGYTVEVVVPMRALELRPYRKNSVVGFDASVGFANRPGTTRTHAVHWAGQSEGAVVDRPGSAALLPQTWGTLIFTPNLPPDTAQKQAKPASKH